MIYIYLAVAKVFNMLAKQCLSIANWGITGLKNETDLISNVDINLITGRNFLVDEESTPENMSKYVGEWVAVSKLTGRIIAHGNDLVTLKEALKGKEDCIFSRPVSGIRA